MEKSMLRDEYELIVDEKEKKPNLYMAKTLLICMLITISGLVLNEWGVYRIDKALMRILSLVSILFCLLPTFIVKNEKWVCNPACKYVIMGIFFIPTFLSVAALNFHVTLLLLFPLLMVTLYRSKELFWGTLVATLFGVVFSSIFGYKMGMWDPTFVEMIYRFSSKMDIVQTSQTSLSESEILKAIVVYMILPKCVVISGLGIIIYGIVKKGLDDIDNRVRIIHLNETDILTDLMNRNMYEIRLEEYVKDCNNTVVCMFADVNGLHDLNNEKGHAAGDLMLKCVAEAIKEQFEKEDVYRIGGDEFVAFAKDVSLEDMVFKLTHIKQEVEKNDYHVSIGIAEINKGEDMLKLIKEAEKNMYEEKRKYYENTGKERRKREK